MFRAPLISTLQEGGARIGRLLEWPGPWVEPVVKYCRASAPNRGGRRGPCSSRQPSPSSIVCDGWLT